MPVTINAKDLALEPILDPGIAVLRPALARGSNLAAAVADRDVEIAVFAEEETSGVVVPVRRRHIVNQNRLTARCRPVQDKSRHTVHWQVTRVGRAAPKLLPGIEEINVVVGAEIRVDRDAQEAALEIRADLAGNIEDLRSCPAAPVVEPAALASNQHRAVRGKRDVGGRADRHDGAVRESTGYRGLRGRTVQE